MIGARDANVGRLSDGVFDTLIVGGGITGMGIALDLAARGARVALAEKADFASGTSSRSSKLVHGGLRYLAQYQFSVTRESLEERDRLARLAPDLVATLPFLIPCRGGPLAVARLAAGLSLYDAMSHGSGRRFTHCSPSGAQRLAPWMRVDDLDTTFVYWDCQTDDAALVLAVGAQAGSRGAVLANYCAVVSVQPDGDRHVAVIRDGIRGHETIARARSIVCATGAWSPGSIRGASEHSLTVRPSKGVHLFLKRDRFPLRCACYLPTGIDNRLIFVVPWHDRVLVGTTDTDYGGAVDRPTVEPEDVDYLLAALRHNRRDFGLSRDDVVGAQAGLRPLVRTDQASTRASREEHVWSADNRVIGITGGKLTTYRRMAERVGTTVAGWLGLPRAPVTRDLPIAPRTVNVESSPSPSIAPSEAQINRWIRETGACRVGDVLARRSRLLLLDHRSAIRASGAVADVMAGELDWSNEQRARELEVFAREADAHGLPEWRTDGYSAA
ncbi:MAG: glycerol-3-phosphate dehydrogenase/oxidase [Chloroflexota bacterium]|nr:MAG: glycerol-3-phosphate dehydrogenase/oxidase [Chloroflexota bacterium]